MTHAVYYLIIFGVFSCFICYNVTILTLNMVNIFRFILSMEKVHNKTMCDLRDKYISIDGNSIRYREVGTGPVLVLVHGIAGFIEEWEPAMETLSRHFRVIALDLLGHGLSDKPEADYSLDFLTDFLKKFIQTFTVGGIYLAGHSLGGAICLNFAIKFPGMVERLILVNSIFVKIPLFIRLASFKFMKNLKLKPPAFITKATVRRIFYKKESVSEEWIDKACGYFNIPGASRVMFSIINSSISIRGLKRKQFAGFMEGIEKLDVPVLIFYGKNDKILSYKNSLLLHRVLKNSRYVAVKNCGHELQVESCDIFCEKTIEFLKRI